MILINHVTAPIRKERLNPTSKAKREACLNDGIEKSRVPDRIESFREVSSRRDRQRPQPGFVKSIQNGLSKEQNMIKNRLSRAETCLAGKENGAGKVIGVDRSRFPGRGTGEDVSKEGRRASDKTEKKVHRFMVRVRREKSKSPAMPRSGL